MTPERQELAFEIFDAAIARPQAERERFVALKCLDDQELRAEVRSLLAAHADASGFLSRRAESASPAMTEDRQPASPALRTGDRLGVFLIEDFVGAGGMGEVYRARDTRLDRHVAIKVLLADGAADPRRRVRFMSEARAIARISHPNICALHDIGQHDAIDFLVMEYLEGESLSDRLRKGRLPLAEALRIAIEIGRALAAAHARGIVHRDVKPGNVMLTRSGAKLLDFGLARLRAPAPVDRSSAVAQSSHTTPGLIVGTVQYMSPEQLEGADVDARTDVFAFGAVLYEMVIGRKAFQGETPASAISSIMSAQPPPISGIEPLAPPALDRLVRKCLERARDERWSSMHDALAVLEWVREMPNAEHGRPAVTRPARERLLLAALAGYAIVAAIAAWAVWPVPSGTIAGRFDISLPGNVSFDDWTDAPVMSPDGRHVVFAASQDGVRRLMLRRLDHRDVTSLVGTDGVYGNPFWSSDSRSVAFFAGRQLKRVAVTGGAAVSVCTCESALRSGGSWNDDGVLLFADRSGIRSVREDGTALQSLTRLAAGDFAHLSPAFLPDGRHFLYAVFGDRPGIYAASLDGGAATRIVEDGSRAQYVGDRYLLFTRGEALFAQPFDLRARQLRGSPAAVAEDVFWGGFSASMNGVVAYRPASTRLSRLAWFDRDGRRLSVVGDAGRHVLVSLSPSGRKVAIQRREEGGNHDLWLLDLGTEIFSRLTTGPAIDADPVWSPDERRLVFTSNRQGRFTLYQRDLTSGKEEPLLADPPAPGASVDDWSADGRVVIFRRGFGEAIYSLPMEGERKPQLIAETPRGSDQSHLSPDGKWLAFQAYDSGRWEIYVATFPGFTERRQVSTNGGMEPIWRPDGRELFYLDLDGQLMAVPVATEPAPNLGTPAPLFQTGMRPYHLNQYAVARDGQKFLLLEPDRSSIESLTFVLDWPAQLPPK